MSVVSKDVKSPKAIKQALIDAMQRHVQANSAKVTRDKLRSLGYDRFIDVPPERYAEIMPHFAA